MNKHPLAINISSIKKSTKREGKYEKELLLILNNYFLKNGYNITSHVSLNFAWGSVLSEVDILALKYDKITIIEIKSKHDKILEANKQFNKIKNYIDYYYIASNSNINENNFNEKIGLLKINDDIKILKNAKYLNNKIIKNDLLKLRKKCLIKMCVKTDSNIYINKEKLSDIIIRTYNDDKLKKTIRKVLFCNRQCKECLL